MLREGLALVADMARGRCARDVVSVVPVQRGQRVKNKLTCDRSCAEDGIIYRLVDLQ